MSGRGTIDRRPRANGTVAWRARWTDAGGRHTRTFERREDAVAFLATVDQQRAHGTYRPPSRVTVKDIVETYIARSRDRLQPSTVRVYSIRARHHIYPTLGGVIADRLTTPQVQAWIDGMRDGGTLSASTMHAVIAVLTAALAEAARIGVIANNPAQGIRRPTIRTGSAEVWTIPEVRAVIRQAAKVPMTHALYRLVLAVGLRPGELRALRWDDLDVERRRLHVRRTTAVTESGSVHVRAGTKRGKGRVVRLSPELVEVLLAWREKTTGPYMFGGTSALGDYAWRKLHAALCRAAGVPVIGLHGLRHTAATLLMEQGVHPRVVSDVLGHSGVSITLDRYSHPSDDLLGTAADAVEMVWRTTTDDADTGDT